MTSFRVCHDYNPLKLGAARRKARAYTKTPALHICRLRSAALELVFQVAQRIPAFIIQRRRAIAALAIKVTAALQAQPAAIFAADGLDRHLEQHLFAQYVFEREAIAGVIADLSVSLVDSNFIGA